MNEKEAELVGMHVGDGTLYKTKWSTVWEIRGNLNEKEYYAHIKKLLESVFKNEIFTPKYRSGGKNGCFGIQTSNKRVTCFFMDYDFKPGCKTYTNCIPKYIRQAKKDEIKLSFIRGLFDTDGCFRFDKINGHKQHTYPRIEFSFASKKQRDQLLRMLTELGYRGYKWGKNAYKLCLAGKFNLEKFMREVSPKNTKHINKYLFWRMNGYINPNAAVA